MGLPERTGGAVLAGMCSGDHAVAAARRGVFSFLVERTAGGDAPQNRSPHGSGLMLSPVASGECVMMAA
jgi:hypothetical protein